MDKLKIGRDGIEYIYLDELTEKVKEPSYCNRCGKVLSRKTLSYGYDIYTGEPVEKVYLICPTLNSRHLIWDTDEKDYYYD